MNRQSLYLRPDPARVVVRPFKPATEPRDLNATDKIRANHFVGKVLRLDTEAAAHLLSDVLESILQPEYPWEFVQIGNCGSPIELNDCWLLFTPGVGPVRK